MKKITAILPMRAGSKRIKNKNIRLINKKLLYEYILNTLIKSKYINKIIINSDIQKKFFRKIKNSKVIYLERKKSLRGNCNMNDVISETIKNCDDEFYIQTHATNPLLNYKTIDNAISFYIKNKNKYDSIFSVTKIQKRLWNLNQKPINHKINDEPTTQNLIKIFEENSCFYIFSKKSFLKKNNRIGVKPKMFEISKFESLDIDEEIDINIAKIMTQIK